MAFLVKETVLGDGNSYVSVEYANEYFSERMNTDWIGTEQDKQSYLIRATDYISTRFSRFFLESVLNAEYVHENLKRACCEYAVRAISSVLSPDPVYNSSGYDVVQVESNLAGKLIAKYEVVKDKSEPTLFRSYPFADALIATILKNDRRTIR